MVHTVDMILAVPVEDGGFQGFARDGIDAVEVVIEGRHVGGDVSEDKVGEAEEAVEGLPAAPHPVPSVMAPRQRKTRMCDQAVGVTAFGELREDQRARAGGGADVDEPFSCWKKRTALCKNSSITSLSAPRAFVKCLRACACA